MILPDTTKVSAAELAEELYSNADEILGIDGNQNPMNRSELTCGQTQIIAQLMLMAWKKLAALATTRA